jgi:hypothetical protein
MMQCSDDLYLIRRLQAGDNDAMRGLDLKIERRSSK